MEPSAEKIRHLIQDTAEQNYRRVRIWGKTHFTIGDLYFWLAAFLSGLVSVGYAYLFNGAERVSHWIMRSHPHGVFIASPVFFLLAWWVVHRYSQEARGSGIPQVMAAIETLDEKIESKATDALLSLRTAIIKILSSVFCVVGGGAVGREGPTIQIAACIFDFVGKFSKNRGVKFNRNSWLIAGGAAGIAAAFNTPLGGLVFAIEELATSHFNKFKTSLISAVIIAGLVAQSLMGSYLYLGYPKITQVGNIIALWALLVGGLSGIWGALFGVILFRINNYRLKISSPRGLAIWACGCGIIMAALIYFLGKYGAGPGRETVAQLLFRESENGPAQLAIARFVAPIISYVSGCAGGVFAPSLAAGGALGAWLASVFHVSYVNHFILLGMIGFLTGITRAPFTSFVLVLEMTDRHSAILPMMLAAVAALIASYLVDARSFYSRVKDQFAEKEKGA